ncbi:MAG: hypothetical protein WDN49_14410 [Acetobacteraceae bacterium]
MTEVGMTTVPGSTTRVITHAVGGRAQLGTPQLGAGEPGGSLGLAQLGAAASISSMRGPVTASDSAASVCAVWGAGRVERAPGVVDGLLRRGVSLHQGLLAVEGRFGVREGGLRCRSIGAAWSISSGRVPCSSLSSCAWAASRRARGQPQRILIGRRVEFGDHFRRL